MQAPFTPWNIAVGIAGLGELGNIYYSLSYEFALFIKNEKRNFNIFYLLCII